MLAKMADPTPISFARGAPSMDIVDVEGLRAAADEVLREDPAGALSYGTAWGYGPLRSWIAERHGVPPERVLVTNGSMQADAFLFDVTVGEGDVVVVERPTYDRTLLSLTERGADLRPIGLEDDGLDVAELEQALDSGLDPSLAHIIPTFHNPAGCTLSEAKRRRLLELARDHDFLIFEDDPYVEIRFSGQALPRMLELAHGDEVVYASSFSKTVCPGVRVGYLVGPEPLIERIRKRAVSTYISPSMIAEAIVHRFCAGGGMERSVGTVRNALRERSATLTAALRDALPEARFVEPEGGYFLWLEFPDATDAGAVVDAAAQRGLQCVKGTDFMASGGENALRIAYSGVTPAEIAEGVARLAEAHAEVTGARG